MKKILFLASLFLTVFTGVVNAEYFRRHYIVVVDQTPEMIKHPEMIKLYNDFREVLLKSDDETLKFDPSKDAISLYAFGLEGAFNTAGQLIPNTPYADIFHTSGFDSQYSKFIKSFIQPRSDYKSNNGKDFGSFLNSDMKKLFNGNDNLAKKIDQHSGVTLSKYVYPAILDPAYMSDAEPAVENYLVVVTNYMSGSYDNGTSQDQKLLRDLLHGEGPLKQFEKRFDDLEYPFFRIPLYRNKTTANGSNSAIPVLEVYKLGVKAFERVSTYITSNLELKETGLNPQKLEINDVEISFNKQGNNDKEEVKVDAIILEIRKDGKLIYSGNVLDKAEYDEKTRKYRINEMNVKLDENVSRGDELQFCYVFYTNALDRDGNPTLPIVYLADREVSGASIAFIDTDRRRSIAIWITIIALIIILTSLIMLGRKKKLDFKVGHFAQKFVNVSDTEGAVELPCWFIKPQGSMENSLQVEGQVKNRFSFAYKGQVKFYARLQSCKPTGFSWYINGKKAEDFIQIPIKGGRFKFNITIRVDDPTVLDKDLNLCETLLDFKIESRIFGLFPKVDNPVPDGERIRFYVKEDLGRAWVGFDPGTTGSCIAYGNTGGSLENPAIRMVMLENNDTIIPSRLAFNKPINKAVNALVPGVDYIYGYQAKQNWRAFINRGYPVFQSIKKLLGYRNSEDDRIEVKINNTTTEFTGLQLAHLLVKGLKYELDRSVASLSAADRTRYLGNQIEARRAVVAIPNNYTLPKINEMVKSVRMLDTFEEVRFIYESEGVLFNYLRKRYRSQKAGEETVMVYDMGGATINITIFHITYADNGDGSIHYHIRTLGRIGYAVGGDNIDVALMEYLFTNQAQGSHSEENRHKHEISRKAEILDHMLQMKIDAIAAIKDSNVEASNVFYDGSVYENFIDSVLGNYANAIEQSEGGSAQQRVRTIVQSQELEKFIYSNIRDAVTEILNFPQVQSLSSINTLIFSGRSTLFPNIRKTVREIVKNKYPDVKIYQGFSDDEIKTAVAYGACWYGIYNSLITVDNSNLSSAYGFKITMNGASNLNVLLNQNDAFEDGQSINEILFSGLFDADGNVVDFYQISGSGYGEDLFSEGNRHKVTPIGTIDVTTTTQKIGMSVDRNNTVTCWIEFVTGQTDRINDLKVTGRDIEKDNDWAYTFHTTNSTN